MSLTLFSHPLASYCHKVLIALYEIGVPFEQRLVDLGHPDDRAQLAAIWPLVKIPLLRDHARGRDLAETSIIIEYLDHFYPAPQPLLPTAWDEALEVRLWDRFFDLHVQAPMQAIVAHKLKGGNEALSAEHTALASAYAMLDARMATRDWVAGTHLTMADCAAAPALFYAVTLQPFPQGATHLATYFQRLMAQPSVRRVIEEARPYFALYPFVDRIAPQFRHGA